jgi:hypothetical protein
MTEVAERLRFGIVTRVPPVPCASRATAVAAGLRPGSEEALRTPAETTATLRLTLWPPYWQREPLTVSATAVQKRQSRVGRFLRI